jgi:uncharacterized protein YbbK (DUF523 family)
MRDDRDRPRVGISRCLLGDEVRHDGGHKLEAALVSELTPHVDWVPVCPEVEAGMGVPRDPIHLVLEASGVRAGPTHVRLVGVNSHEDWTERMVSWGRARLRELAAMRLSGYVLKSRSPSCGMRDVALHAHHAETSPTLSGRGLFAAALIEAMPDLPVEDEERLRDPEVRRAFLERVLAFRSQ